METTTNKNLATFIHLSSLTQYVFPFGNYIFPILLWTSNRDKSEFINQSGKQVLNFQISMFLYSLILAMIAIPILVITFFSTIPMETIIHDGELIVHDFSLEKISGIVIIAVLALLLFVGLKVAEFFLIILAAVKTSNGETYNYPITIPFIK